MYVLANIVLHWHQEMNVCPLFPYNSTKGTGCLGTTSCDIYIYGPSGVTNITLDVGYVCVAGPGGQVVSLVNQREVNLM